MLGSQLAVVFKLNQPYNHIYSTNKKHAFMGCNYWTAKTMGLTCEQEAIGKFVYDLHSDASNLYLENNEEVLKTGIDKIFNEPVELNGNLIVFLSHKYPLKNEKGKTIGVMGMSIGVDQSIKNKFNLSPQQEKCFQLILQGFRSKEIAEQMQLSHRTIEHYIAAIKVKLQCRSLRELILRYAN
jgi:DNA-binding CsgD family transcriptional regulator